MIRTRLPARARLARCRSLLRVLGPLATALAIDLGLPSPALPYLARVAQAEGPPAGKRFASMSSGVGHTCGLRADDGTVACWGDDAYGQASPPAGARFLGSEPKPPNPYDPGAPLAWSKGATPTSAMPDAQLRRGRLREAGQTLPV